MNPPPTIRNVPQWEEHCRKIRARALDLIEGRVGVIESSRELAKLAYWTHLRDDVDLETFVFIESETDTLPVGEVRQHWAEHALAVQDIEITRAKGLYMESALKAARSIVGRFSWSLEAREKRRNVGHDA